MVLSVICHNGTVVSVWIMFANGMKCNTTNAICKANFNLTDNADTVQNNTIGGKKFIE